MKALLTTLTICLLLLTAVSAASAGVISFDRETSGSDSAISEIDLASCDSTPPVWQSDDSNDTAGAVAAEVFQVISAGFDTASTARIEYPPLEDILTLRDNQLPPSPLLDGLIRPS